MRRADRLFQIVQMLRGRRLVTARKLAEELEVSERTIYRDVADLQATGVPIDGAAGMGYVLREGFDLPPLMFNRAEVAALVVGARMVRAFGGESLGRAAEEALIKIESVLPKSERHVAEDTELHALNFSLRPETRRALDDLEEHVRLRRVIRVRYHSLKDEWSERHLRPLGVYFWGRVWTLLAWCEHREGFRNFRVDRLESIDATDRTFVPEPGKTTRDYVEWARAQGEIPE